MSSQGPTPGQARAAIAEAAAARAPLRTSDRLFAQRLLAFAAATVGLAAVLAVFGSLPSWLGLVGGVVVIGGFAGAVIMVVWVQMRQHAYTRVGNRLFLAVLLLWVFWGQAVLQFSFHSAWMDHALPQFIRGLHFVLSAGIGVVPLLVGALLFGWRR